VIVPDRLAKTTQSDRMSETKKHEIFKTTVEVCKANDINFSLICTADVDMAKQGGEDHEEQDVQGRSVFRYERS